MVWLRVLLNRLANTFLKRLSFSSLIGDGSFFMASKGTRRKINVLNHGCGGRNSKPLEIC